MLKLGRLKKMIEYIVKFKENGEFELGEMLVRCKNCLRQNIDCPV